MGLRTLSGSLFAALFAVQVALPAASLACASQDHAHRQVMGSVADAPVEADAMHGMDMTGSPSEPGGSHESCEHPPSRNCEAMSPCGVSFVMPANAGAPAAMIPPALLVATSAAAPRSIFFKPEPPPPRA